MVCRSDGGQGRPASVSLRASALRRSDEYSLPRSFKRWTGSLTQDSLYRTRWRPRADILAPSACCGSRPSAVRAGHVAAIDDMGHTDRRITVLREDGECPAVGPHRREQGLS